MVTSALSLQRGWTAQGKRETTKGNSAAAFAMKRTSPMSMASNGPALARTSCENYVPVQVNSISIIRLVAWPALVETIAPVPGRRPQIVAPQFGIVNDRLAAEEPGPRLVPETRQGVLVETGKEEIVVREEGEIGRVDGVPPRLEVQRGAQVSRMAVRAHARIAPRQLSHDLCCLIA